MPDDRSPGRAAVLANLALPGAGYLLAGRRRVLGALIASATLVWGVVGILHVLTLDAHWGHLHPSAFPGIGAQVLLYVSHHALLAAATAWDVGRAPEGRNAEGVPGA